jgi:GNAT superfamily N-acetyltransferase
MAYTDAGTANGDLIYIASPKLQSYYHLGCAVSPLTKDVVQLLIDHELFDGRYNEHHNGLRGIYQAQMDDDGSPNTDRPIARLHVFYEEGLPIAVLVARRVTTLSGVNYLLHVYVKPQWRRQGYGRRLLRQSLMFDNLSSMAMEETDLSKKLLTSFSAIRPIRRPTQLDRDYTRCVRALERNEKWTNEEGSLLGTETILATLKAQAEEIKRLRKQLNPYDNAIHYPC